MDTKIISPRINFRKLTLEDAPAWEEFLSNAKAVKFFAPISNVKQFAVEWMQKTLNRYATDGFGLYALIEKESENFIGQCGLMKQEVDGVMEFEISYHIIPRHWNNGFASEAAISVKNFAFENSLAESIVSIIVTENLPSIKVAEKNGMHREKQTKWRDADVFIYRITKSEWL
jgi:RimJ/RimL family protein N-acetyltransferase